MKNKFNALGVVLIIGALMVSCSYSSSKALVFLNDAKNKKYDMIVVPGVPFGENNEMAWSRTMKGRIYWSKYLFDQGIAKNVMYSGSAVYTAYNEAEIMALYAEAIGIPKANIFTETKAEHSVENIYYGYKKSKKMGFDKIALASDPFQTKSLSKFVRLRLGEDVGLIPMVLDTIQKMDPAMLNPVIDYKQAYKTDFVSIKEREGFWERLRGTRGKKIDLNAY